MKALAVLQQAGADLELGARYRDTVSDWEGTLTDVYVYMNGCVRCCLSGVDKDKQPKGFTFDQEQIELVPGKTVRTKKSRPSGGPRDSSPVAR